MSNCDISVELEDTPTYEIILPADNPIYVETTTVQSAESTVDFVINEIPMGLIDGVNKTFQTAFNFISSNIWVYLNGLRLVPADYTIIDSNTIELTDAPLDEPDADILTVDYIK